MDVPGEKVKSGKLVMIRHGTSMFNKNHQFTGWLDPEVRDLSPRNVEQK
jgi:bisphosphoglycerate-dependent phosphoglycerate mutase